MYRFFRLPKTACNKRRKNCLLVGDMQKWKRYNTYKTEKQMFTDWCYGLPCAFNMDYQQYKVIELCANFGLKTPKNDYELFDFWYGKLYESVNYLNNKLNK